MGSKAWDWESEEELWEERRSQTWKKYLAKIFSGRGCPLIRILSLTAHKWGEVYRPATYTRVHAGQLSGYDILPTSGS